MRFRRNDGPELVVGVRRKRSGGQQKVGLKIDVTETVIFNELARVERAAGAALDADPHVGGSTASAVGGLRSWWSARLAAAQMQVAGR